MIESVLVKKYKESLEQKEELQKTDASEMQTVMPETERTEAEINEPVERLPEPKQPEMTRMASKYPRFYKISINSSAINRPELIREAAEKFGSQCVVVAIDAKKRADGTGWNIYKNGGRLDVGIDAVEWAKKVESLGAGEILLTSMDGDGTKAGYDLELTRAIADSVSIPVIASGGAGTLEHFKEALTDGGADAALAASLFHYKELEIKDVKEYLRNEGISVRL